MPSQVLTSNLSKRSRKLQERLNFSSLNVRRIISETKKFEIVEVCRDKNFYEAFRKMNLHYQVEVQIFNTDDEEIRMVRYHMASTTLNVKIGDSYEKKLKTNIGAPQGDCLSPMIFVV